MSRLHRVGERPSEEIWSRSYSFNDGLTLDYVYELEGDELRIFFMRKDLYNRFVGTFNKDCSSYSGAWAWPGGGYAVQAKKVA